MYPVLFIESAAHGVLDINGQFCGPLAGEGQAFPCGRDTEIYLRFFPFGEGAPLTAALALRGGKIARLEPRESVFALVWPDGVIQLELRPNAAHLPAQEAVPSRQAAPNALLRYLMMKLSGDAQACSLWLRPQDEAAAPDLGAYHAAVPLRFAPEEIGGRCDMRAGLVRRAAENVAVVDAALAITSPAGQGRRLIERMEIVKT